MKTVYLTRGVRENIEMEVLSSIVSVLEEKENQENVDYLQIFEFEDDVMINRQEVPEKKEEYKLNFKTQKIKLWAILNVDETIGEYWTILLPSEY